MELLPRHRQKLVAVMKDSRGIKTKVNSVAWHPDGNTIMCGAGDGSLQLWEARPARLESRSLAPPLQRVAHAAAPDLVSEGRR